MTQGLDEGVVAGVAWGVLVALLLGFLAGFSLWVDFAQARALPSYVVALVPLMCAGLVAVVARAFRAVGR